MNRVLVLSNVLLLLAVLILCACYQVERGRTASARFTIPPSTMETSDNARENEAMARELRRVTNHAALEHLMRVSLQYQVRHQEQTVKQVPSDRRTD